MDNNFDFLFQLGIDTAPGMKDMAHFFKEFKDKAVEGVVVPIDVKMDLNDAKDEMRSVAEKMGDLAKKISDAERASVKMGKSTETTLQAMVADAPKLGRALVQAFGKGGEEAKRTLNKVNSHLDKAESKLTQMAKTRSFGAIAATVASEKRDDLNREISELRKLADEHKKIKKEMSQLSPFEEVDRARLGDLRQRIWKRMRRRKNLISRRYFEGDPDMAESALRGTYFDDRHQRALGKVRNFRAAANASYKELSTTARSPESTALRADMAKLVATFEALLNHSRQLALKSNASGGKAAVGVGGLAAKVGAVDTQAEPATLLNSITAILNDKVFKVHVVADADVFVNSLRELTHLINTGGGLTVDVRGIAKGVESALNAAGEVSERRRTRDETRVNIGDKAEARRRGSSIEGVEDFINDSKISPFISPEMATRLREITAWKSVGTPDEMASRAKTAIGNIDPVKEFFNNFSRDSGASDEVKERMLAFSRGFGTEYITGLSRHARTVEENGPAITPRGMRAGVDYAGEDLHQQAWRKVVDDKITQNRNFAARYGAMGGEAEAWTEAEKAFKSYQRAMSMVERRSVDVANAQTVGDQVRAYKHLNKAQGTLAGAEDYLAQRLLAGGPGVTVGNESFSRSEGYFVSRGILRQNLGGTLDKMNAGRSANNQMTLSGLQAGLFGGDKSIASEYLKAAGVTDDLLKDDKAITAELEKHIGLLRDTHRVYETIEQDLREQKGILRDLTSPTTKAHVAGLAMDGRRTAFDAGVENAAFDAMRRRDRDEAYVQNAAIDAARRGARFDAGVTDEARNFALYGGTGRYTRSRVVDIGGRNGAEAQAYKEQRRRIGGSMAGWQGGFGDTLRNGLAMFGGVGIGYTAVNSIRNQMRTYMEFQQEMANIQGVLGSKNKGDALNIGAGVATVSAKYGMDLLETARAAKVLAQSGLEASEVIRELDYTMAAAKGLGMTIEQVQELQVAVRAVTLANDEFNTSINWSAAVLDKVSAVEARYAVSSQDLANSIQILSPLVDNFSNGMTSLTDSFDYTIALTTVMVEKLRITGTQAANILKLTFSRIARPEILNNLQEKYGLQIGDAETGDYLPLDRMIQQFGEKYAQLDPTKQKQFAVELGGGRNIAGITVILEEYAKVAKIAREAAFSFGDTQKRAEIGTNTLLTAVGRMKTGFSLYIKDALEATSVSDALTMAVNGLAGAFNSFSAGGSLGGGMGTFLALIGGGLAFSGLKKAYSLLSMASKAGTALGGLGRGFGLLARFLSPGGVILTGLFLAGSLLGTLASRSRKAREEAERYGVTLRDLNSADFQNAPLYQTFLSQSKKFKLGTPQGALDTVAARLTGSLDVFDPNTSHLSKSFDEIIGMDDGARDEWIKNNSGALRQFSRAVATDFIGSLGPAQRKMFDGLKTDTERLAAVVDLVGGAAWGAAYQMSAAINDVHASTQRMTDDTLAGLKKIDDAKRGFFKAPVATEQIALNSDWSTAFKRSKATDEFTRIYGELPDISRFMRDPQLKNALRDRVLTDERLAGPLTPQDMFRSFVGLLASDPALMERAAKAKSKTANDPMYDDMGNVLTVQFANGKTAQQTVTEVLNNVTRRAQAIDEADIRARNTTASEAEIKALLLQAGIGGGTPEFMAAEAGRKRARDAMAKFEDALFDLTVSIFEAIRSFEREQQFAQRMGLGFNRNEALIGIARTAFDGGPRTQDSVLTDLAKLAKESKSLSTLLVPKTNADGTQRKRTETENAEIDIRKKQLEKALGDLNTISLSSILGLPGEEGENFKKALDTAVKGLTGEDAPETLGELLDAIVALGVAAQQNIFVFERQTKLLEIAGEQAKRLGELEEARLPVGALTIRRLMISQEVARKQFSLDMQKLDLQEKQGTLVGERLRLERESLTTAYEFNAALDARLAIAEAQNALDDAGRENLDNMMSGIKGTLTDQSIWQAIVDPEGDDSEERARNKARAIRDVIFQTINPIFKTITDRYIDAATESLADTLMEFTSVRKVLSAPESKLKLDLQAAQMNYEWVVKAGNVVGTMWYQSIVSAGGVVAGQFSTTGVTTGGTGLGSLDEFGDWRKGQDLFETKNPDAQRQLDGKKLLENMAKQQAKARRDAMIQGAGVMVGTIGGTMAGGGGKGAQMGSNIGSTVGMLGAAGLAKLGGSWGAVGGPVGMAVGAAIGGILGGLIGGKRDKKEEEQPVIRGLEAVERAQRETISTIQAQTDALLKPENRLMNLPSTFNVPQYAPSFGGGSGALLIEKIEVNVPVTSNASPADIQGAVETAVGNVLANQRRNRRW